MYDNVVHDLIQFVKEVIVDTLIIEEDRPAHIAKHNIIIDEVLEVLTGDYVYCRTGESLAGYWQNCQTSIFDHRVRGAAGEKHVWAYHRPAVQTKGAEFLYRIRNTKRG